MPGCSTALEQQITMRCRRTRDECSGTELCSGSTAQIGSDRHGTLTNLPYSVREPSVSSRPGGRVARRARTRGVRSALQVVPLTEIDLVAVEDAVPRPHRVPGSQGDNLAAGTRVSGNRIATRTAEQICWIAGWLERHCRRSCREKRRNYRRNHQLPDSPFHLRVSLLLRTRATVLAGSYLADAGALGHSLLPLLECPHESAPIATGTSTRLPYSVHDPS